MAQVHAVTPCSSQSHDFFGSGWTTAEWSKDYKYVRVKLVEAADYSEVLAKL